MKKIFEKKLKREMSVLDMFFLYSILIVIGTIMIYPLLWMVGGAFKSNAEIFSSISIIPKGEIVLDSFTKAWSGIGSHTFTRYFANTFMIVITKTIFTVISSVFIAYGFARFEYPYKKILTAILIATLMLPESVLFVPQYVMFKQFGWIDTYKPLTIPFIFGTHTFFIFMMIQFFRGIPKDLDEAAIIDGCNYFQVLFHILVPVIKPAIITTFLIQFIWSFNDFLNPLLYVYSVEKYPISLALRMSMDLGAAVQWSEIMALSVLATIPPIVLFLFTQKYFVEGISTSGLKG
ncbi:MAG: carbohydrate ABC transporter permease [Cetobacterium sp.]